MKKVLSALAFTAAFGIAAAMARAQIVKIDGSSTVFPITEAVAEEFQMAKKGKIRVTVGISGTGGGFKKFCRGEIDIGGASRPIEQSEIDACRKAGEKYGRCFHTISLSCMMIPLLPVPGFAVRQRIVHFQRHLV